MEYDYLRDGTIEISSCRHGLHVSVLLSFIRRLLDGALSNSVCTSPDDWMAQNKELERTGKELVLA